MTSISISKSFLTRKKLPRRQKLNRTRSAEVLNVLYFLYRKTMSSKQTSHPIYLFSVHQLLWFCNQGSQLCALLLSKLASNISFYELHISRTSSRFQLFKLRIININNRMQDNDFLLLFFFVIGSISYEKANFNTF